MHSTSKHRPVPPVEHPPRPGDEPVHPTPDRSMQIGAGQTLLLSGYAGLTKREHMAALCMQGLLACSTYEHNNETTAKAAVNAADCLLAELAKDRK